MPQINKQHKTIITSVLLILMFFSFKSYGQEEDVSIETTTEKVQKVPYPYLNINDYEQTTLLKLNSLTLTKNFYRISGEVEQKVFPFLSVLINGELFKNDINTHEVIGGGFRYYPQKRERSKPSSFNINNFSGNYLSVNFTQDLKAQKFMGRKTFQNQHYSVSIGRQEKVGKLGYFDIGLEVTYNTNRFSNANATLNIGFKANGGLAYGPTNATKQKLTISNKNIVENVVWKGYYISASNFSVNIGKEFFDMLNGFAAEFVLGKYLTFRPVIWFHSTRYLKSRSYLRDPNGDLVLFDESYGKNFSAITSWQFRKYVGIKKKLKNGKQVNAFTGNYIGVQFNGLSGIRLTNQDSEVGDEKIRFSINPTVIYGWQYRVSKRFLFDANIEADYNFRDNRPFLRVNASIDFLLKT